LGNFLVRGNQRILRRRLLARLGMIADTLTAIGIYITVAVLSAAAVTDLWL
jgi:hypothetical protein